MQPELAVTMRDLRPLVHAQINGRDAMFIADSGAFFSFVGPAAVREFQMRPDSSVHDLLVWGVGGTEHAQVARAKTFTIIGMTVPDVPFVVAGSAWGDGAAGLLGQNVFRLADVEYDLANGVIRLVRPKDCKDTPLAYWASAADKPYSVIDIDFATAREPHTKAIAYLNGTKIRVVFDTGAATSVLTLDAAKHAGITPNSEGVEPGGLGSGIGHKVAQSWIAPFASFKIGDEEIKHARLRFGTVELVGADMLIGADFFLSHRVYVASSQRKLYFTYNGGPVFNLATARAPASAADAQPDLGAPVAGESKAAETAAALLDQPTDAAGYARRGAASTARHDYQSAIADLTRACELAPTESSFFYERGIARWSNTQADMALTDFDQAIKLKPDNVDALVARVSLRANRHDSGDALIADLEAADRAAPKDAAVHMRIGRLYEYAEQPAAAVVQYSKWIDSHPRDDLSMPSALNSRCWARALMGQGLEQALADCNSALKLKPNTAAFLDSRGLVYLRQNNYDKAIADYDAALRLQPKIAWSLYGRGLAKLHKGKGAEGQTDLAAAIALEPKIAEQAAARGIGP
ncbi:MAG TPA: aspartyl protease family protein [Steroidobacteraceae bacterium]